MFLNGQLVRGPSGMAGEFGHVSLDENGPLCNCGNRGCWEVYASNVAATKYYEQSLSGQRAKKPGRPETSFLDLLSHTRQGDARAVEALDRMAHYLGAGLAMLVSGFSPEAIVVVGEVTEAWDRVAPVIDDVIKRRCPAFAIPSILPTNPVGGQPRLRGAIALILQKHFAAPQIV
jgi:predicted NBD/HSP70 family sugar kinase